MAHFEYNQQTLEPALLRDTLQAFHATTGLIATARHLRNTDTKAIRGPEVQIQITRDGRTWDFFAELRNQLTPALIRKAEELPDRPTNNRILVTYYVTANMAERLRAKQQRFMDTAGNAYIDEPDLLIYVIGRRPERTAPPVTKALRLNATGLRIVFLLLCDETACDDNYRDLAARTDTAVGTVANYFAQLRANKYIIGQGHARHLTNKGALFREWVAAYPRRLRPKLLLGRFRAPERNWWANIDVGRYDAYWGGEIAAARLTNYLKPATQTIYTHGNLTDLIAAGRLRKDPQGPIEILKAFWPRNETLLQRDQDLVHPILVFADLAALGDTRADEAAEMLLNAELDRFAR